MPGASPKWRRYQREAAEFFESLGFTATVDASVDGARSRHDIDVLVEFDAFGIHHRWIVECKAWNRRVPKERVEVLKSIVQETGADRGFLLCERSFQSGAITAARLSNITLTSIEDLRANAEAELADLRWDDLFKRWFDWHNEWHEIQTTRETYPVLCAHVNAMGAVEQGLASFRQGRFPAPCGADTDWDADKIQYRRAATPAEFLDRAEATISAAEEFLRAQAPTRPAPN